MFISVIATRIFPLVSLPRLLFLPSVLKLLREEKRGKKYTARFLARVFHSKRGENVLFICESFFTYHRVPVRTWELINSLITSVLKYWIGNFVIVHKLFDLLIRDSKMITYYRIWMDETFPILIIFTLATLFLIHSTFCLFQIKTILFTYLILICYNTLI